MKLRWQRMRESTAASSAAMLERPGAKPMGENGDDEVTCPTCDGSGTIMGGKRQCPDCNGSGEVPADSPVLKESAIVRDFADLREAQPLDFFGDGSLRESAVQRLSERDYSTAKRIEMAKSGDAIPVRNDSGEITGGAYPAQSAADVDAALQAYGRSPSPETKAHIVKVAKKHGTPEQVKRAQALGQTSEATDVLERLGRIEAEIGPLRRLREAKPGQLGTTYGTPSRVKTADGQEGYAVDLIKEGAGNSDDDRWYPGSAIKEMCESGVAEGMQAYADHPDLEEEQIRPERSVKQLVGHYRDVKFAESGSSPRAQAVFVPLTLNETHPTYGWVVTLAEAASRNTGPQPLCGISLYGYSACDYGARPDGSEGPIATLIRPTSGDIVTNAGAGGGFIQRVMESARRAQLRNTIRKETRPMRAEDYTNKVAEATKRLREADSDEARNDAIADLEALQGQAIDAPPKPVDTVEALTEAAPKLVEQIREAAKKEGGENVEALQAQLKEAQGALSQFTDVVDLGTRLREAGVSDETELRYFAGQARSRGLREATDIKEMVEAERAYHKRQQDALDERLKEATEGLDMFGIEGAFAREPAGGGDSGAAGLASLRESGVPMKKTPAAA